MQDASTQVLQQAYDETPYVSLPLPQAAPERLAAIAGLFGLSAVDPARARVLELGCASGGHLVPFAAHNPDAHAMGLDLSQVQVDEGRARIAALGLANLELRQADLSEPLEGLGKFDYIICHGVYSWVPPPVQDAILRICREHLSPDGIAMVSYNAYPGWKTKEIVRDAMMLRGEGHATPQERLGHARGMIDFLSKMTPANSLMAGIMHEYAPLLKQARGDYLIHEFLESCNSPCYFKDFLARAGQHGLGYLAEAEPSIMFASNLERHVAEPLLRECAGDQRKLEQYMDFLLNRTFRQTMLVHESRASGVSYRITDQRFRELHFAAKLAPLDGPVRFDTSMQNFGPSASQKIGLASPVVKAAAVALAEAWPSTASFEALVGAVRLQTGQWTSGSEREVLEFLGFLTRHGLASYRREPVRIGRDAGAKPRLAEVVRLRAALAREESVGAHTFNAWHEPVMLNPVDLELLPLMDGHHGRKDFLAALHEAARAQRIRVSRHGRALAGSELDATLESLVDETIARVVSMKVLQA